MRNLNVYSTAYAAFVENLALIAPVMILVIHGYTDYVCNDYLGRPFNRLAMDLGVIGQAAIFNLGHSGMQHNPFMFLAIIPQTAAVQSLFGPYALVAEDHEVHHICPSSNFALNFRFWDSLMGSYKPMDAVLKSEATQR